MKLSSLLRLDGVQTWFDETHGQRFASKIPKAVEAGRDTMVIAIYPEFAVACQTALWISFMERVEEADGTRFVRSLVESRCTSGDLTIDQIGYPFAGPKLSI